VARRLVAPGGIQVSRKGARRLPQRREALALALGALGSVNRYAGVKTLNLDIDGRPTALALIEDAQFGQDADGNTTLSEFETNDYEKDSR
jgi:hypothetical protein